jgi:hypothetical protein
VDGDDGGEPGRRDRDGHRVVDEVQSRGHVAGGASRGQASGRHGQGARDDAVAGRIRGDVVQRHRANGELSIGPEHVPVGQHRDPLGPVAGGELREQPPDVRLGPADAPGEQREQAEADVHGREASRAKRRT